MPASPISNNTINSTFSFTNNSVTISSFSNINSIYGSYISLSAAHATSSITFTSSFYLDNNHITINSSCSVSQIYAALLYLNKNRNNNSTYNPHTISISSNTIEINQPISNCNNISLAELYLHDNNVQNLFLTNNKISISTSNLHLPNTSISLVNSSYSQNANINNLVILNNTLEFINATNILLNSISGFDSFTFDLPNNVINEYTILNLSKQSDNITVDVHKLHISNYAHFSSITNINLIDSYGDGNISLTNTNGSYLYDNTRTELKVIDKALIFTFNPQIAPSPVDPIDPSPDSPIRDSITLDPQTLAISQGGAANVAFVSQGLDLIMDEGLFSATNQAAKSKASSFNEEPFFSTKGISPFAAVCASKHKYFTSNIDDIDVNGFSVIAGLAKDSSISNHNLTIGAFFEHGNSKFETSNFFNYDPTDDFTVAGNGHAHYNGGGLLARLDLVNNIYIDASARLGNASCDYFTSDLTKLSNFSYDYSTTYYGAHGGLGYLLNVNENLGIDFSGKYFFTSLAGKQVDLPENQSIKFETESVERIKIGAKLQIDDSFMNSYIGAGFEYEPTNKIEATISNKSVDTPELGGGKGLIEAGFNTSYKNFGVDLSAKYSDGKAGNSIGGMLKFSYKI